VHTVRTIYHYKVKPTPKHLRALETVLWSCRMLYHTALEQRKTWWERGQGIGATCYQPTAERPHLKAACPDCAEVNAHVLQDVLVRVERTSQAHFCQVQVGETPGYHRFQGWGRYQSFTSPQIGDQGDARLDNGVPALCNSGRRAVRWSRPL